MKKLLYITLSFVFLLLSSCTSKYDKYDKYLGATIDVLYSVGLYNLTAGNLNEAKKVFERIIDNNPFTEEAVEANILLMWIYYIQDNRSDLELLTDVFLKYYVENKYTSWVTYMNSMAKFESIYPTNKDQSYTYDAFLAFQKIVNENKIDQAYVKEAKSKIEVIKYILAKQDNEIAFTYLKNRNYISALKRYQNILNLYPNTEFIKEAMYRLIYIWEALGEQDEAFKILSTLGYNYPDSQWYAMSLDLFKKASPKYNINSVIKTNRISDQ